MRSLNAAFDLVVSPGASLSRRLAAGGLEKVVTIPLGVQPGVFRPALARPELRREMLDRLALPDDCVILVGVGRFAAEKRWPMVIRAAASVATQRPVGLLLIGAGKGRNKLIREAARSPHVVVGQPNSDRAELAALLASADALVHGCESETFCLVASEARASGLPIIVPDRGGAFDQLSPGAGLAYHAADERALAEAIVTFHDTPGAFSRSVLASTRVRTMDGHFWYLMGHYERLAGSNILPRRPALAG